MTMYNRFRSEFYRALHSRMTWILLAVCLLAVFFSAYDSFWLLSPKNENFMDGIYQSFHTYMTEYSGGAWNPPADQLLFPSFSPQGIFYLNNTIFNYFDVTLISVFFTALFCGSFYTSGYAKNLSASPYGRSSQILGQLSVVAIWILAAGILRILLAAIMGVLYFGSTAIYDPGTLFSVLMRNYLLTLAVNTLVLLFTVVLKQTTAPLVLGLLYVLGLPLPLLDLADWLCNQLLRLLSVSGSFRLSDFTVFINLMELNPYIHTVRNFITGTAGIAFYLSISLYAVRKTDLV